MTCPASNPFAPLYTCWQRIPGITDPQEILRCQQCPHGMLLIASVTWQREADQDAPDQGDALQKEDIIMDKQAYTVAELSRLIGIPTIYIYSAKNAKNPPMPGSKSGDVLEAMRKHGIAWDQIVSAPKGGGRKTDKALVPEKELNVTEVRTTTAEPTQTMDDQEGREHSPATNITRGEELCARWSLDMLIKAVRAKLPAKTSITICS